MKAVVQRVTHARVFIGAELVGAIEAGLVVLLGIERGDDASAADELARRIVGLRCFADAAGRMQRSLVDGGGALLVVSQFTLCADLGRGRRPSFDAAEEASRAAPLVERFGAACELLGVRTARGRFGAHMRPQLANDGPVTFLFEHRSGPRSGPALPTQVLA